MNVTDGSWHHVALTTLPGRQPGYQLYVDGELAAELPNAEWEARGGGNAVVADAIGDMLFGSGDGSVPEAAEVDGGDPVLTTGEYLLHILRYKRKWRTLYGRHETARLG